MKAEFPGYYPPSDNEFEHLWEEALIAFDANVLLNLYRYSEGTRGELFKLLNRLEKRLWLPHQAALEYHKNRLAVIATLEDAYEKISESVTDFENRLLNALNGFSRHPLIQIGSMTDVLKETFARIKSDLSDTKKKHPELTRDDRVRDEVTRVFEGKVGPAYSAEELRKIYAEGKTRYEKNVPPGFKDDHKDDESKYGDLVVWKQLIDKARESGKPLIFVTDDRKEDWWEKAKGKVIRPRPELIQEIWSAAGVKFYMYQTDPFMEQAAKQLKRRVKQNAIDEIKEVRKYYDGLLLNRREGPSPMIAFDADVVSKKYSDYFNELQKAGLDNLLERSANDRFSEMLTRQYLHNKLGSDEFWKSFIVKGQKGGLLNLYDDDLQEPSKDDDE